MGKLFFTSLWLIFLGTTFGQNQQLDFEVVRVSSTLEFEEDSLLFPKDQFDALSLSFEVSNADSLRKVCVMISSENDPNGIIRKYYTSFDLLTMDMVKNNTISIPLGNVKKNEAYLVSIIAEDKLGVERKSISKSI